MTASASTERLFSLSCFEGLRLLRRYRRVYPRHSIGELIDLIEKVEADGASLDLDASIHLGELIQDDCPTEGVVFYQICIKSVLVKHQPIWAKTMRQGRRRFIRSLNQDDQDVFAAAGLLKDPPPRDVILWWDDVSGHARFIHDQPKLEQGRQAELLTLEYEKRRLERIGINKEPQWPGLDDNFAGYDVLSYDHSISGVVNRMIEVKSTTASPLRFYVSRNEWRQAERVGDPYLFHVWDMTKDEPILHIRSVSDVAPHVPSDNGRGVWTSAEISIGAL